MLRAEEDQCFAQKGAVNPTGLSGGPFGFSLRSNPQEFANPTGLSGGSFGFVLQCKPRLTANPGGWIRLAT